MPPKKGRASLDELMEQGEQRSAEARKTFNKYDADMSGSIDSTEVAKVLKDLGLMDKLQTDPAAFLASQFAKFDKDGDGTLSFDEFRDFYNQAVSNANGRGGGGGKKPSPEQKKLAAKAAASVNDGDFPGVTKASHEELVNFAATLNAKLSPKQQKEWMKIFSLIDQDKSGKIVFGELEEYVRGQKSWGNGHGGLDIPKSKLPKEKLQAIWLAMEPDKKGCIAASHFGKMIKLGARDAGPTWQENLASKKAAEGAAARKEMDSLVGRDLAEQFAHISPSDAAFVKKISEQCWAKLEAMPNMAKPIDPFKLFGAMDSDRSGRIQFDELEAFMRGGTSYMRGLLTSGMGYPKSELSDDQLKGLWLAVDADESGYICSSDFAYFMRAGAPDGGETWKERLQAEKNAEVEAHKKEKLSLKGADLSQQWRADGVEPCDVRLAMAVAVMLLDHLHETHPELDSHPWKLFGAMDADCSGTIHFDELRDLLRGNLSYMVKNFVGGLNLGKDELSDRDLQGLWLYLDETGTGYLKAPEFRKWINLGLEGSGRSATGILQ